MLPHELTGNSEAKTLLVFLHGFPDSVRLWDETIQGLQGQDAQFLNISYPNFHASETRYFGVDFPEIIERIKITVDTVDGGRNLKKVFVTHDWGAVFGYLFDQKYPNYMAEMITLDVGGHLQPTAKELLMILSYQWTFAACFILSLLPILGNWAGTLLASLYMRFVLGFRPPQNYSAKLNYPYFYYHKNKILNIRNRSKLYLAGYQPSVPVVFMYGSRKPFQFHSSKWKLMLSKNASSEFIEMPTGHWIMREQGPKVVEKIIQRLRK